MGHKEKTFSTHMSHGWQVVEAIRDSGAPADRDEDAASADPDARDPPSPAEDDSETLIMGNWPEGNEAEEGGESSSEEDDEEVDDELLPNVAADSAGNIHEGLNLKALAVGPVPPTPPDSPVEDDVKVGGCDGSECHKGDERAASESLVTPPPKRNDFLAGESAPKKRKVEARCASNAADDVSWIDGVGGRGQVAVCRGGERFPLQSFCECFKHCNPTCWNSGCSFGICLGLDQ